MIKWKGKRFNVHVPLSTFRYLWYCFYIYVCNSTHLPSHSSSILLLVSVLTHKGAYETFSDLKKTQNFISLEPPWPFPPTGYWLIRAHQIMWHLFVFVVITFSGKRLVRENNDKKARMFSEIFSWHSAPISTSCGTNCPQIQAIRFCLKGKSHSTFFNSPCRELLRSTFALDLSLCSFECIVHNHLWLSFDIIL